MDRNIEKPTSMSPRALYELRQILKRECDGIQNEECSAAYRAIADYEKSIRAETIKVVIRAIRNTTTAYKLESTSVCNIASDYDGGTLTFKIKFDPLGAKQTSSYQKIIDKIDKIRSDAKDRLDAWYREGLYLIANKKEVPRFDPEGE